MMGNSFKHLYFKEFGSYFRTSLGPVFLVIFLMGIGQLTFEIGRGSFFFTRTASLDPFFRYIPWLYLFLVPAVSMKLWSEERKTGTIELLFTLPVEIKDAVLAKFFAAWSFIGIALLGTFPMLITVGYLGDPDWGVIFLGYLASFLISGVLIAIGGFFSALTKNAIVGFILTATTSLMLLMAGAPPVLDFVSAFFPKYFVQLLESLSLLNHFDMIRRGVLSVSNLWFFAVMISCWLYGNMALLNDNKAS